MPRYTLLLAGCLLLTSSATAQTAQPARLNVSVQGGIIRNLQSEDLRQPLYTFYPEVQIASRPFPLVRGISLQGGLHWGYWNDGVREHKLGQDHNTYSQSSHIAGVRFHIIPTEISFVYTSLFSGLSWHFVSSDFLGGFDECLYNPGICIHGSDRGNHSGEAYHERFNALEVGLRVAVPLGNRLAVTTEVQKYFHTSTLEVDLHTRLSDSGQFAYKLGLSFGFF